MYIGISDYEVICNLGIGIDEVYQNAVSGICDRFKQRKDIIKGKDVRVACVDIELPIITQDIYNTRCNQLVLKCLELLGVNKVIEKYGVDNVGVVVATTNTGVEEYETSKISNYFELGNPAEFIRDYYGLKNFCTSVSTACSSGIKAFSVARDILNSNIAESVIVVGVDSLAKLSIFGFDSLGVLSTKPTNSFSKNREGINIGEGVAGFILEKNKGIKILGIGETTDVYHSTCPDPDAIESIKTLRMAIDESGIEPKDVDYINLHGTGTVSNDLMESKAVYSVFGSSVMCSSTKALTGHCLGAAATIEIGLCCKLIEIGFSKLYPHVYDGEYDEKLSKINLVSKGIQKQVKTCLCTSFGFGGTNTAIVLGGKNE